MIFKSERLLFREFSKDDIDFFYSVFSNKDIMKYALKDYSKNKSDIENCFNRVLENNKSKEQRKIYEFAVFLSKEEDYIGFAEIEITYQNECGGCGEIGYFILSDYWGMGYATEIAKAMCKFSFEEIKLHRVCASCNANNKNSENVMIKIGMEKEGEFIKARFKNGQWHNELRYSIINETWNTK